MNEKRCPEGSKEQVGGRTQCAKQRLKYLQNVAKIIENRGLEGSKIKENRDLEGSSGSSWQSWAQRGLGWIDLERLGAKVPLS